MGNCGEVQCGECTSPDTRGGSGIEHQCGCVCQLDHATPKCLAGLCSVAGCDPGWLDCDGVASTGCETDVNTSMSNCGECGSVCALANAVSACKSGACSIVSCQTGYADCDGDPSTGCEVNTKADPQHCGNCSTVCPSQGATPVCSGSVCGISNCPMGKADCDGISGNGCEVDTQTSPQHCGFCNNACSVPNGTGKCVAGACQVGSCAAGYGDCDGLAANGCESATSGSVQNCGSCGHACPAGSNAAASCTAGNCQLICNGGFGNCDAIVSNGCEVYLPYDAMNCGSCGATCQAAHGTAGCSNGHCAVTWCQSGWSDCDGR